MSDYATPAHTRQYVHTSSTGAQFVILVNGEDRWYRLPSGAYTHAGFLPDTAAGRYAFDRYRALAQVSPRRAYRAMHDDYMLETPEVHTRAAWAPRPLPGPRAQARLHRAEVERVLSAMRAECAQNAAETYGAAGMSR